MRCRDSPSPSIPNSTTSPDLRYCGGFIPGPTPAGVPVEMHIFQHGAHGAGLAAANPQLSDWPDLLAKWMRERGYMAPQ